MKATCATLRRRAARTSCFSHLLLIFLALISSAAQAQAIRVAGQDTLVLVAQKWREIFAMDQPQLAASIRIEGGNRGLAALTSQTADIIQTRASLPSAANSSVVRVPVAIEAIVVYVNDANPVSELTIAELKAIFTGKIANWRQLGGPDQRIELYAGESTTGINEYFRQAVLKGEEADYEGKATTKALLETIAAKRNAMGYGSLGFMSGVHAVRIRRSEGQSAVTPTPSSIRNLQYPISRYVYWYLNRSANDAVRAFSKWIYSPRGQLVADAVGFFPLLPDDRASSLARLGLN